MKKLFSPILSISYFLLSSIFFIACSEEEKCIDKYQTTEGQTSVHIRSNSDDITSELPVYIYAFNSSDECIDLQISESMDENFSFNLPVGNNKLYVIAGATTDQYILPDQSDATANTIISLKGATSGHAELMAGSKEIVLTGKNTEEITVMIDRIVAQVTAVIEDVPQSITDVNIHLKPLEENVLLDGTYGGDGKGEITFSLSKKGEGLWETPEPVFILPGADDVSITIIFTDPEGTHTFAYNKAIPIEANYKTEITAAYKTGMQDITGRIRSSDWAGKHEVKFDFGEGADTDIEKLAVCDIYEDCFVLEIINESETQSTILLMSPREMNDITLTNMHEIAKYRVNEIGDWRLPDKAEAQLFYDLYKSKSIDLNDILQNAGMLPITSTKKYLCTDEQDEVYYFTPENTIFDAKNKLLQSKGTARLVKEIVVIYK